MIRTTMITVRTMNSDKVKQAMVMSHQLDILKCGETEDFNDIKPSESKIDEVNKQADEESQPEIKNVNISTNGTENVDTFEVEKCEDQNYGALASTLKGYKEVNSLGELGNGESKQRRRSRLSLNSESKSKSKFKEDTNQASIVSFFQKMSPKTPEGLKELHQSEEKKCELNVELNESSSKGSSKLNCEMALKEKDTENKKSNEISLKGSKKKLRLKEGEEKEAAKADENISSTGFKATGKDLANSAENKVSERESFQHIKSTDVNQESSSHIDVKVSANLTKEEYLKSAESSKKQNKDSRKLKKKTVDKKQELLSSKVIKEKTKSKLRRKSITEADSKVKSREPSSTPNKKNKKNMKEEIRNGSKSEKSKEETKRVTLIEVDDNADTEEVSKEAKQNDFQHFKEATRGDSDAKENKKVRFSEEIKEFSPKPVRKNHPVAEVEDVVDEKINTNEHQAEESSKTEIKNVFAFMMNSRHKSIGQNSPGKEAEKSDEPSEVRAHKKNQLASRKAIFQVWADAKGAKKRKLEDEEKGVIIEVKLKRRAKRLKKMLTQDQTLDDNEDKNESVRKRHSEVLQIIESDSEGAPDSDIADHRQQKATNLPEKSKHKLKKRKRRFSSEKADKESKSLCVDSCNSDCCVSEIEVSDVNSNLKENASKSSPSTPLQQTALSSFFEIVTSKKLASVKSKLQLKSDSQPQMKKNKPKSKLALKKTIDASCAIIVDDLSQSSMEINDENLLNKSATTESPKENSAARKREIQMALTPNTVKKWKMRLRVKLGEHDDETIEKLLYANIVLKSAEDEDDVVKIKKRSKVLESSDSDSDEPLASKNYCKGKEALGRKSDKMQPVKLAPLFIKAKPKPKVDKATIEARRKFLHSSLPDSLKKVIEKQQRLEEIEYEVFPSISHVTAKPTPEQLTSCTTNFWSLPGVDLKLKRLEPCHPNIALLSLGSVTNSNVPDNSKAPLQVVPKITRFKRILKTIKAENPDYPVYKAFRFLHEKHLKYFTEQNRQEVAVEAEVKVKKSKRGRPKKKVKLDEDCVEVNKPQMCEQKLNRQELWTDKYKPASSEEIFGNHASVAHLKTWLTTWVEFSEEIKVQRGRRKRKNSDSSSDFEGDSNTDSRDSSRLPGNTLILCGPCGSGKTSAVYALCGELGVNVLELNASSKRTGKRLLLELQEATQSHQVRKKDASSLASFIKRDESSPFSQSSNSQSSDSQSSTSDKKMCLILIEDVDIVFEQDESFLSALGQMLAMSKRPIVLTTTDTNCLHLKKFFLQYPVVNFVPLSSKILATWLQILCLVEGLHVERRAVAELLEHNGGDVRCTLLQLQFWVQSGGQSKLPEALSVHCPSTTVGDFDGSLCKDDSSNIGWLNEEETEQDGDFVAVHSNCLEYFRPSNDYSGLCGALPLDLGSVWWNLPGTLRMPQPLEHKKIKTDILKNEEPVVSSVSIDKRVEYQNLRNVVDIFETLAMTDVVYENLTIDCDLEPVHRSMSNRVKNSLDLSESMESWSTSKNISCEWSRTMLNGYVDIYNNGNLGSSSFNYSAVDEKRWRTKHSKCKDALLEAVPVLCHLDHRYVNMDYFSALRTMVRSELIRASSNSKRGNRFYNYLRGVGISCSDSFFKTVCDVFCHES